MRRSPLAATLLLALAACGDDGGKTPTDAPKPPVDAPPDVPFDAPVPPANHFHYVMDSMLVPMNNNQARDYGLDLNSDQTVDNQLGMVMATLSSQGFDIQTATTESIDKGRILELFNFGADSFTSSPAATFAAYAGATPMPPPCNNAGDMVCRRNLTGAGTFTIAATSPMNPPLTGVLTAGAMIAGPGHLVAPITMFSGGVPMYITLIGARVQLSMASDPRIMMLKLAGGISQTDIDTKLIPTMRDGMEAQVMQQCTMLANPPQCGCPNGSTADSLLGLFDTAPQNCSISIAEVRDNSLIQSLLAPDVTLEGQRALSYGVRATAVKAGFVAP